MKKYITIVLLLIIAGAVLGFLLFKENQRLAENVNAQTTEAIRNMKVLDSELNVLLLKSRYGLEDNYDNIAKKSINLRKEFDNLRNKILFNEIQQNKVLQQKFTNYEEQLVIKQDLVEGFKTNNAVLINSSNTMLVLGGLVFDIAKLMKDVNAKDYIANLNLAAYKFLMTEDVHSKEYIQSSFAGLKKYEPNLGEYESGLFSQYILHLRTILERLEETQSYLLGAVGQPTSEALHDLETTYTGYHNTIIENSNKLRKAMIIYGLILLVTLLFFAILLRKNYQAVELESELFYHHMMDTNK